jgi:hypothetical protein
VSARPNLCRSSIRRRKRREKTEHPGRWVGGDESAQQILVQAADILHQIIEVMIAPIHSEVEDHMS